ncbi:hypothetical protein HYR69_00865 [Candidatus Sumerlaeota bacterium]|nr:hypothetical protein [Candidatus Sumerlaeota bacterium]
MSIRNLLLNQRGEARWTTLVVAAAAWIESCAELRKIGHSDGKEDVLKFSHKKHAQYVKNCADCHAQKPGGEIVRATHAACVACHAAAAPITPETKGDHSCLLCHHSENPAKVSRAERPDYAHANFDHEKHTDVACAVCHGNVESAGIGGGINFPRMEDCLQCHGQNLSRPSEANCALCHFAITATTKPKDHDAPDWGSAAHGRASMNDPPLCLRCHEPAKDCETCHTTERPPSHTASFRAQTHGFHAMNNPESCQTCHAQEFCEACHRTTEPLNHTAAFKGRPYLHCATCHLPLEEGNRCSVCHEGDPHEHVHATPPPDYLIEEGEIKLDEPCLPCHPVRRVPITHPYNTISSLECIQCHHPP